MIDQVPPAIQSLTPLIYKALLGIAVGGLGALMLWPFRAARKEWKSLKENTSAILEELSHQRNNCLNTLQNQGYEQIRLMEKMSGTLENIHLSQSEMTGFCKANTLASACRPSRKRSKKA